MTNLSIVVPCYNEQEVLPITAQRLTALLRRLRAVGKIGSGSNIYFVDDGSRDRTWLLINDLASSYPEICGVKLSRNCGHQNALLAGLFNASGDIVVSIDADLQDDESVIEEMVDKYSQGYDIVLGVRSDRSSDTFFKRFTARSYYRLLSLMGVDVVHDHADFRLMSRPVIESLKEYREVNLYLRGMIPLLGFNTAEVFYKRASRLAGESKYPLSKMIALSVQGVTSLSITPIRLVVMLGFIISILSMAGAVWALGIKLFTSDAVPGWASLVVPQFFLGGLQLISIGVIGEYIGKIYLETKQRPRFTIEKTTRIMPLIKPQNSGECLQSINDSNQLVQ